MDIGEHVPRPRTLVVGERDRALRLQHRSYPVTVWNAAWRGVLDIFLSPVRRATRPTREDRTIEVEARCEPAANPTGFIDRCETPFVYG